MKDVALYVFLFVLYSVLALRFFSAPVMNSQEILGWETFGGILLIFAVSATLARWSVLAFKKRAQSLLAGQKIIGIEEAEAENVIDVIRPQKLRREEKKPKLKRRRFL